VAERGAENRLAGVSSPYLLQHADNPVDWHPWGEEALSLSRSSQRPIFLSIGYAACHWCHVMAHESFADPAVAERLNRSFVAVKVDREERPDIDAVYMAAVQAMTGAGGWPLSVFLTPDLQPFFGGTYFPPQRRWGKPSFLEVLDAVDDAWQRRRDAVLAGAADLSQHLRAVTASAPAEVDSAAATARALEELERSHDPGSGGFGAAPKFPTPARLLFLVGRAAAGLDTARRLLAATLDGMAAGGMWDWVGGGFHRYSVDASWLIPHFEKMLYDNALLARAYGEAGVRCREPRWIEVARRTADYLVREMQGPEGGFYSSTDADSEGEEGRFFTWTAAEVREALPEEQAQAVVWLCRLDGEANFENGRSVLRPALPLAELARRLGTDERRAADLAEAARRGLFAARADRVPPLLDDKRLAAWNGMAIWALAWLGAVLEQPRYLEAALRAAAFVRRELLPESAPLVRSWRNGSRAGAETLEDLAWVGAGFVELYQATGEPDWLRSASAVIRRRLPRYRGADGRLFETPDDGEQLPLRPRSPLDGATPASGAVLARTLLRLAALTADPELAATATAAIRADAAALAGIPGAATSLVEAAAEAAAPPTELVVVGEAGWPSTRALLARARAAACPPLVTAAALTVPVPADLAALVPLFAGRETCPEGRALAYLCTGGTCELPLADADGLAARLAAPPPAPASSTVAPAGARAFPEPGEGA